MAEFIIQNSDNRTQARLGVLKLPSGIVNTPAFMPDATRAVTRAIDNFDSENAGVQMSVVNTLHLFLQPGIKRMIKMGGVKKFMKTNSLLLSDSGGFQVFSLSQKLKSTKQTEKGFVLNSPYDGRQVIFTPKESIDMQFALGTDAQVVMDVCTGSQDYYEVAKTLPITKNWEEQSKERFLYHVKKLKLSKQNIPCQFGVIQGGPFLDLRKKSYHDLEQLDFLGYGYGGWPLTSTGILDVDILRCITEMVPEHKVRYGMGLGTPADIVTGVGMGYDLFDTVLPSRDARHGRLYVLEGYLYIKKKKYITDEKPLEIDCHCYTCINYSRQYLHHLFKLKETLFLRLATIHNVYFYSKLMANIRLSIERGDYIDFMKKFIWKKKVV